MSIALPYALRLSPTIRNEWRVRCIGDVIPALEGACFDVSVFRTDRETVEEIRKDCAFMLHPDGPDLHPGEAAAYRGLLAQCVAILKGARGS